MVNKATTILVVAGLLGFSARVSARQWTLHECINYALANNMAHPTKSVAGPNQTPTIPDRKRTECPLPHAVGF